MDETKVRVLVGGLLLAGALYLLDVVYLPLLLVGPLVTGVLVARRSGPRGVAVGLWVVAGVTLLVSDAVINREDVVFHLVVTAMTALLAWGAWAAAQRRRALA